MRNVEANLVFIVTFFFLTILALYTIILMLYPPRDFYHVMLIGIGIISLITLYLTVIYEIRKHEVERDNKQVAILT
jgi:polyferredoxin